MIRWLEKTWDELGLNRMVIALSIARMADGIGNSLLFVLIPLYVQKEASIGLALPVAVGLLISGYGLAATITQPIMGSIGDRYGHSKLFIQLGLLTLGSATLAFIWARTFVTMLVLRVVQGTGLAMEIPATMTLLTLATRKETRGGAMGVYATFRMVGLAVGPIVGGLLYEVIGFTWTYVAAAAVLFTAAIIVQVAVHPGEAAPKRSGKGTETTLRSLVNLPILSVTFATLVMAAAYTLISTLENEFDKRLNIGAFEFGLAFSALMIGRLLFQIPVGHASDKHGRKPFILAGLIALAPITLFLGLVTDIYEFAGLRFLQGLASAAIISPALAFASDMSKKGSEGRQTSLVTIGFSAGLAVGPLIAGFLSLVFFELSFLVLAALAVVALIIVWIYMPRRTRDREGEAPA